jgi:hypothetical protein
MECDCVSYHRNGVCKHMLALANWLDDSGRPLFDLEGDDSLGRVQCRVHCMVQCRVQFKVQCRVQCTVHSTHGALGRHVW